MDIEAHDTERTSPSDRAPAMARRPSARCGGDFGVAVSSADVDRDRSMLIQRKVRNFVQ
jgi:hypothetical protein